MEWITIYHLGNLVIAMICRDLFGFVHIVPMPHLIILIYDFTFP